MDGEWYFSRRREQHWYAADVTERPQAVGFNGWEADPDEPALPDGLPLLGGLLEGDVMEHGTRLAGKTALVTGGGQGVGRGIALALAAEGAAVVITGRTERKLKDTAGQIAERGGRAHTVVGDVGERDDVDRMVAETVREFGGLDVLVNNAQSSVQRRLEKTSYDDVELTYRSGPLAAFHAMRAALPHLKASRGSVVNLGSSAAVQGEETFAAYAMAKEAIRGLTRVAAREWGAYGIRVNVICPAALSPAAEAYLAADPDRAAQVTGRHPAGPARRPGGRHRPGGGGAGQRRHGLSDRRDAHAGGRAHADRLTPAAATGFRRRPARAARPAAPASPPPGGPGPRRCARRARGGGA